MKTAIQLYTLRNEAKKDLEGVLKTVSDAGYDGVELAGLYGLNGDQMKALLDKYGLRAISAHIKYAVVPMTPRPTEENRN